MYKLSELSYGKQTSVIRLTDGACIPFDPANSDYAAFKIQVASGVELQDPDGVPMTPEAVAEFLAGLP